jgi:hypothetical protein
MSTFVPQYGIVRYKIALEIEKPLVHRLGSPTDVLYNSVNATKAKVSGVGNLFMKYELFGISIYNNI